MYDWWCFDRHSRQISAFTMVTMEIYLYTCHNIVTNVYYGSTNCLGIRVGMGLKIFRLITSKSKSIDLQASKVSRIRGYKIICYLQPAIVITKLWEIVHRLLKFLLYFKKGHRHKTFPLYRQLDTLL